MCSFEKMKSVIEREYEELCSLCSLQVQPLDIQASNNLTDDFFSKKEKMILIKLPDDNITKFTDVNFPPEHYNENKIIDIWPYWRKCLWHEFIHQIQDAQFGGAKEYHEDPESWNNAVQYLIDRLANIQSYSVSIEKLSKICDAY